MTRVHRLIATWVGRSSVADAISPHQWAVLQALFVTALWSSSYVLITIGLEKIPALTFAGLRYAGATIVLLPMFVYYGHHRSIFACDRRELGALVLLGLLLYTVTQGAQFVALQYITAATVSLLLSFTPALVALLGIPLLGERPSSRQWVWIGVLLLGVGIYFYPFGFRGVVLFGLAVMALGLLANSLSSIVGRYVNHELSLSPLAVTTVSMGLGSAVLLAGGITVQGLPSLSVQAWLIVLWLAIVNTAFAFTLWNRTLQTLSATDSSVINNTMLVQVALLGWVFLGESLSALDIVGLGLVLVGAMAVQLTE